MVSITMRIAGPPRGKERPRFVKATGRTYTPKDTQAAEARVREAWRMEDSIDLGGGPLRATVVLIVSRPKGHWRVDGSLSAAGRRSWVPVRKPDLDNSQKLLFDSLNGYAYRDDAQIVDVRARRVWGLQGEREGVLFTLEQMERPA